MVRATLNGCYRGQFGGRGRSIFSHRSRHSKSSCNRTTTCSIHGGTGFIASLLKLPAIQEICGEFGEFNRGFRHTSVLEFGKTKSMENNLMESDSSSSPLNNLDLAAQSMRQEDLSYVLRAPTALKTFSFKLCSLRTWISQMYETLWRLRNITWRVLALIITKRLILGADAEVLLSMRAWHPLSASAPSRSLRPMSSLRL